MKVLLDTHSLFWFIEGSSQLSEAAREIISKPGHAIFVSPASYWEMAIKISLGKWKLNRPYDDFLDVAFSGYGFQTIPVLPRHTSRLLALPFHHKDPFDRLIVAQALVDQLPIVSADQSLDTYGVQRIW